MTVRVDKWLWAVRVFKTRAAANDACTKGRVSVNGEVAKPATKVKVGDEVTARRKDRTIVYGVVQLLEKRVGAPLAADAVDDRSPPEPERSGLDILPGMIRERGAGRPTKKELRDLNRLRGR